MTNPHVKLSKGHQFSQSLKRTSITNEKPIADVDKDPKSQQFSEKKKKRGKQEYL